MITLALDASTYVGSVAVIADSEVVAECEAAMRGEHEERLMPAVVDTLTAAGIALVDVDRVVCGAGPGSFTSLRIAGSIAKGLALGGGLPLYAVPSLALLVGARVRPSGSYVAAMDAMRGEWYAGVYTVERGGGHRPSNAISVSEAQPVRVVPGMDVRLMAATHGARLVGATLSIDGETGESATTTDPMDRPHARGVVSLHPSLQIGPVDLGMWEPVYGRLAEAQVKWEAAHGRPLASG